jgi:hypothetical protein
MDRTLGPNSPYRKLLHRLAVGQFRVHSDDNQHQATHGSAFGSAICPFLNATNWTTAGQSDKLCGQPDPRATIPLMIQPGDDGLTAFASRSVPNLEAHLRPIIRGPCRSGQFFCGRMPISVHPRPYSPFPMTRGVANGKEMPVESPRPWHLSLHAARTSRHTPKPFRGACVPLYIPHEHAIRSGRVSSELGVS